MDQIVLIILLLIMASVIIGLVWAVIFLIWKLKRKERYVVETPFNIIQEMHTPDKDRNGIPDGIERKIEHMEKEMEYTDATGKGFIQRRSWGSFDANINGRRVHQDWGAPPDGDSKRMDMSIDLYRSGDMSQDEFMEEMKRLSQMKSR